MNNLRCVFDTNTLISAILIGDSVPYQALTKARRSATLLFSAMTFAELESVIMRPKFDRYVSLSTRVEFLATLQVEAERVTISQPITMCRDPKDDQFLEVAVNGNAQWIITGDRDLLDLHPFQAIKIVSAANFLGHGN